MNTLTSEIKKALKQAGFDTKKISVMHKWAGYSEVYRVSVKDKTINLDEVRDVTKRFEEYEVDERTGEILAGGNTFVSVQYDLRLG